MSLSTNRSKNPFFFPEEIIEQILTRLPVKSLLRFKGVSKSWLSLISSPRFIKSHLNISSNSLRIMSTSYAGPVIIQHFSAVSLISDFITEPIDIDYPGRNSGGRVLVVGSCNGLVCIAIGMDDIFIWNPSTRIYKKLPPVDFENESEEWPVYGFGYNEANDEYKVLCMFLSSGDGFESFVYSSKTDSWKWVGEFEGGIPHDDEVCKFFLGKLYFLAHDFNVYQARDDYVVAFDLENEVYEIIERPDYGEDPVLSLSFEVLEGCISILCNRKNCAELWVMKEYGVKESWTKMLRIPYLKFEWERCPFYSNLLTMFPSGEILLFSNSRFVVYNPKDKTLWLTGASNVWEYEILADVYVESLVSPIQGWGIGQVALMQ